MPGKKISKNQVRDYMTYRKSGNSQKKAASKVDISEKSGRNIESGSKEKVQKTREWRTRANPFETVWDDFVVPMLKGQPTLDASFIMEKLQEKYEGQFPDNKLRTFQRHVREWKALYGKDKAIIFRQEHYPGIRRIARSLIIDLGIHAKIESLPSQMVLPQTSTSVPIFQKTSLQSRF
jgi:DNA-binding XRE family transcriptional regulator